MSKPSIIPIFFLVTLLAKHVESQPPTHPNYFIEVCRPAFGNYTPNTPYQTNIHNVLSDLHNLASSTPFSTASRGEGPNKVYGQYYCRGDISIQLCKDCIKAAGDSVFRNCSGSKAAIMWYEECTLRYENQSMLSIEAEYPRSWWSSTQNVTDPKRFSSLLGETFDQLIRRASRRMFATEERRMSGNETLYSLAQCSPDLNGTDCETCLRSAVDFMPACCGNSSAWMYVFYPICQLRYDTESRFYVPQNSPPPEFPPPAPEPVFT